MAGLPPLEEVPNLDLSEVEALIRVSLPPEHVFTIAEERGGFWGVWTSEIRNAEGEVVFTHTFPDYRLTLLAAYGHIWRQQHVPSNPVWRRRRDDLRGAARRGIMHLPGSEAVPDPEDLDPDSVYRFGDKEPK